MIQRITPKREMSVSSDQWCVYCSTPFKNKRYLYQHQKRSKSCKKYMDVLFCCQRCGSFRTKGINNLHSHLDTCIGAWVSKQSQSSEIKDLKLKLEAEKVRSNIYLALLASHTGINITKLVKEKNDNIHLFGVTPDMKFFLHDRLPSTCLSCKKENLEDPSSRCSELQKQSHNYRRAPRCVESNPEPTTQAMSLVIEKIDKRSKETLNQLDDDMTSIIIDSCQKLITQLSSSRNYTKLLRKLKTERAKLLGTLKLQEYIQVVTDHNQELSKLLGQKQQSDKKIRTNILNSLTPIDSRLLRYQGYHETQMDGECRDKLETVLRHGRIFSKEFKPYVIQDLSNKLTTYSVAVFPIEKLIRWALINPYGFWNVVYLCWPKSSLEDPYSFYVLTKIKKGKRYWNMDCRLEDFTIDLISCVQPYLIQTFRELYYTVFNDNDYRSNAAELSSFVAEDCEQLAQNIILMSQPRKLCGKLRNLLAIECTYKHTSQDHFSLLGDDPLQRKKFQQKEKIEMVDTVGQLFDQINDEQAVNFYKSRNM